MAEPLVAYCGPAPSPIDLWQAWNLDPLLLAGLAALALAVARRGGGLPGWGLVAVLGLVFVSPLCALSAALYSARVLHHLLLVAVAAPLMVAAFPSRVAPPLTAAFALHTVVLWIWHAPGPYDWALGSVAGYWLMQASLIATAWALWQTVLRPGARAHAALAGLLGTVAQMGLLAALIVFAPAPLHLAHLATTAPWGLSPLEDQQLAGLLMWAPAILPYLGVALALVWRLAAARPAR